MASSYAVASITPLPAERFFRVSLFLLLLTSMGTLATTGKLDIFTAILAPLAVIYKGYRWWRGHGAELRSRTATWLLIGYLAIFPVDVLVLSRILVANSANPPLYAALLGAVHFLIFVTLVRLYSASSDRDAIFLAMLAFAGILASAVLTVDTIFLLFFFAFLVFAVATFVGIELRRAAKGTVRPDVERGREEKSLNRALMYASLSVALGAIVIGGTLFFFFPRFSAGYLGRTSFNPALMTGFNDDVELGQIGEIKKNTVMVMRVQTGRPVAYQRLRWRGVALANFDGKRWTSADKGADTLSPNSDGWIYIPAAGQKPDPRAPPLLYTVYLEPIASDAIFVPGNVVSLRGNFSGESGTAYRASRQTYLFRDSTNSIFNPFHNYTALRYSGLSRLPALNPTKLRAAPTEYSEDIRKTYLQLPTLDARILPLAKQITANAATPYDQAAAMELYLRSRFSYTLNLSGKPGGDPLAHFLFETRAGHCEYFASAMTVMMRTLGVPAREVNGFLPGEYNELGGDYIVRGSDAHSWVEVYFPENGWVTFDPTPGAPDTPNAFLWRLSKYADWLSLTWNEWIISYDFAHQVVLAQNLQRNSRGWSERLRSWFDNGQQYGRNWMKNWDFRHSRLRYLMPVALVVFLVLVRVDMIPALIRRARYFVKTLPFRSAGGSPQLASRLYGELLRVLERRGWRRRETQTAQEFAAAVVDPQIAPAIQEFTRIYGDARFGEAECNASRLRQLLEQVRKTSHPSAAKA